MAGEDHQIENETAINSNHHQQVDGKSKSSYFESVMEKEVDDVDIADCEDLDYINLDLNECETYFSQSGTTIIMDVTAMSSKSNDKCNKKEIELIILDDSSNESIIITDTCYSKLESNKNYKTDNFSAMLNDNLSCNNNNNSINVTLESIQVQNDQITRDVLKIDQISMSPTPTLNNLTGVLSDQLPRNILCVDEIPKTLTQTLDQNYLNVDKMTHDLLSNELKIQKIQNDTPKQVDLNQHTHDLISKNIEAKTEKLITQLSCEESCSNQIISEIHPNHECNSDLEMKSCVNNNTNSINLEPELNKNEYVLNLSLNNKFVDEVELLAELENEDVNSNITHIIDDDILLQDQYENILDFAPTLEFNKKDFEDISPELWNKNSWLNGTSHYELLHPNDTTYVTIEQRFNSSSKKCDLKVESIARIENLFTFLMYELKRLEVTKLHGSCQELLFFHGTKAKYASSIREENFDWRCHGKDHKFGKGVYFTPLSSYASYYTDEFATGNKMMLVRMLFVEACQGRDDMKYPPFPNDTAVNREKKVYCKFDDSTFYPEYEITYQGKLINWYLLKKHGLLDTFRQNQNNQQFDYTQDSMDNTSGFVDFNSPLAHDLIRIRSGIIDRNVNTQFIQPWLPPNSNHNPFVYHREEPGQYQQNFEPNFNVTENGRPIGQQVYPNYIMTENVSSAYFSEYITTMQKIDQVSRSELQLFSNIENNRPDYPQNVQMQMEVRNEVAPQIFQPQLYPHQQFDIHNDQISRSENNFHQRDNQFQRQVSLRPTFPPSRSCRGQGLRRSKSKKQKRNEARKFHRLAKNNKFH